MAATALSRFLASSYRALVPSAHGRRMLHSYPPLNVRRRTCLLSLPSIFVTKSEYLQKMPPSPRLRFFTAESNDDQKPKPRNTKFNFSLSDSDDSDTEEREHQAKNGSAVATRDREMDKSKLPPPYDPFNKKPIIGEPEDPKNLQEIFHKMRTEGLTDYAVKMFDGLSKDGRTHEALELFSLIKDKGHMPDVVTHTAVMEVYANAGGKSKDALKVFLRMLASGVEANAYTYGVLVKGLASDGKLGDVKKYVMEMMEKGMMPNATTSVAVLEAFVREGKEAEGKQLLLEMKSKGFVADEKSVRDVLNTKRGPIFRRVMDILFGI